MVKMCRPNFRIRLNLSKYYNDVRCFSCIFVDGTKMIEITHIKEHITNLFDIREPFHLLLKNTMYLPPNEDIRIVKENETILVSPGSGLENELNTSQSNVAQPDEVYNSMKVEKSKVSVENDQLQAIFPPVSPMQETIPIDKECKPPNGSSNVSKTFEETVESEADIIDESKTIDANLTDDFDIVENLLRCPKKKRLRRRKKRPQYEPPIMQVEKPKKPKIINSCVISSGKHIRFDNLYSEEVPTTNGSPTNKMSPPHELANLLSLGQNSTPFTFKNPRVKEEFKIEQAEIQLNVASESAAESVAINTKLEEKENIANKVFEKCPIMTEKPQFKDVLAFKMLKIGSDYTPQVSEFIVAEVISCCPKTSVYTFKILEGLSEVQVPVGKFTILEAEEERVMNDTITLNYAQIMEPRNIAITHSNRSYNTSNNCTN